MHGQYDYIVISDYQKGLVTNEMMNMIVSYAKWNNIKILCDPKNGINYCDIWLLKPNKKEMVRLLNGANSFTEEKIISYKKEKLIQNLLITQGEEDVIFIDEDNHIVYFKVPPVNIYSVIGAGDIMLAFLVIGICADFTLIESINLANKIAGLKVSKFRTQIIEVEEVAKCLIKDLGSKLIEEELLIKIIEFEKKKGKKIVFTNGCFDVLHVGYIHLLNECRRCGDIVVLALNTDSSIRELKGKDRPINSLSDRIKCLSAITYIDYIVTFDQLTPIDLIHKIKPDILIRGRDYSLNKLVGAEFVKSYFGEVILVDLYKDISSSKIININKREQGENE